METQCLDDLLNSKYPDGQGVVDGFLKNYGVAVRVIPSEGLYCFKYISEPGTVAKWDTGIPQQCNGCVFELINESAFSHLMAMSRTTECLSQHLQRISEAGHVFGRWRRLSRPFDKLFSTHEKKRRTFRVSHLKAFPENYTMRERVGGACVQMFWTNNYGWRVCTLGDLPDQDCSSDKNASRLREIVSKDGKMHWKDFCALLDAGLTYVFQLCPSFPHIMYLLSCRINTTYDKLYNVDAPRAAEQRLVSTTPFVWRPTMLSVHKNIVSKFENTMDIYSYVQSLYEKGAAEEGWVMYYGESPVMSIKYIDVEFPNRVSSVSSLPLCKQVDVLLQQRHRQSSFENKLELARGQLLLKMCLQAELDGCSDVLLMSTSSELARTCMERVHKEFQRCCGEVKLACLAANTVDPKPITEHAWAYFTDGWSPSAYYVLSTPAKAFLSRNRTYCLSADPKDAGFDKSLEEFMRGLSLDVWWCHIVPLIL